jgi:hypothetical protein
LIHQKIGSQFFYSTKSNLKRRREQAMELKKSFFGSLDDWIDFTGESEILRDQGTLNIHNFIASEKEGFSRESNIHGEALSTFTPLMGSHYNVHGTRISIPVSYQGL